MASEAPSLRLRSVPPDAAAQLAAAPPPSAQPAPIGTTARRPRPIPSPRPERARKAVQAAENTPISSAKLPETPVEYTSYATNVVADDVPNDALIEAPSPLAAPSAAANAPASAPAAADAAALAASQSLASAAPQPLPSPSLGSGISADSSPSTASTLGPVIVPGAARLHYKLSGQSGGQPLAGATAELLWQHDGQSYEARLSVRLLFASLRERSSVGSLGTAGLAPTRFSDKARKASEVATHFERVSGKIVFSANTPEAVLQAGAQDQLSVFLQLGALLAGQAYAVGSISLQTAGPRTAEPWLFSVEPDESLALPIGPLATRKLSRLPRREYEQKVEVWLAPSLGYLPARIKITEANGNFIDQQLRAIDAP